MIRMVITGAGSFIGFHLAKSFYQKGFTVTGTVFKDVTNIAQARIKHLETLGIRLKPLDITNEAMLSAFIQSESPDYWIHHAGWAVDYGSADYDLRQAHLINTLPLSVTYERLSDAGCTGVIVTGTNAEYSDSDQPAHETDLCMPNTPYGLSKLSETIRANQLSLQYSLPTRVARVFIPFGEMDAPQKLLQSVVTALKNGNPIDLSPCVQRRDFLYIDDLVKGYRCLVDDLNRDCLFDIFNLCGGKAIPLKVLLQKTANLLDADPALLKFGAHAMRPGEPPVSYGSNKKARRLFGWIPQSYTKGLFTFLT